MNARHSLLVPALEAPTPSPRREEKDAEPDLAKDDGIYDDLTLVPLTPVCREDLDGDGQVGFGDLLLVLSAWGPCRCCPEDLDQSGAVGFGNLLEVLSAWGPCE